MFFYGFAIGDMVYMENYDDDHKAVAIGGVTIACLSIVFSHTWDDIFGKQDLDKDLLLEPMGKLIY